MESLLSALSTLLSTFPLMLLFLPLLLLLLSRLWSLESGDGEILEGRSTGGTGSAMAAGGVGELGDWLPCACLLASIS